MIRSLMLCSLLLLAACGTPRNIAYCQANGAVPQSPGWSACLQDFAYQQASFDRDRAHCAPAADAIYPPSLYDRGHYETYRRFGRDGFSRAEHVFVPPEYYHNRQLDDLRERLIAPCMFQKGWRNSLRWEAGRR